MPGFEETLNEITEPLFRTASSGYIPSEYLGLDEPGGIVGFESVSLTPQPHINAPIAGYYRRAEREPGISPELQPSGDRFILRGIMGYAQAASALQDPNLLILQVSNIINSMMVAAYKVYGPRIISLQFGSDSAYFRELENCAGYEIRLFGKLTPVSLDFEMETVE